MRLANVERGDGIKNRLIFFMIRRFSGFRAPDVVRTLFYRAPFFGAHHNRHTQAVMRGPSEWTVGERELVAAFVSRLNQCSF
jgi:alkylhydroperoxidase family enzyme